MQASMAYYIRDMQEKLLILTPPTPFTVKKSSHLFPHFHSCGLSKLAILSTQFLLTGFSHKFSKILKIMAVFLVYSVILFAMAIHSGNIHGFL